ncbi:hypothetical protein MYP_3925 [Sporocytophaga myxococcoides]|uniref:3-keto-alpha-glucoside-1,2-lyase/3-keto-2-hydroxy-glucal hydratase domain-containing protein n=1 Tax=Sporocytophaga myxococcoides TaxID=153721 RepID=A0A098LI91_9BACT|nr:DUF1080 domain-containing protein [Sporocytophaga myxococcoides]GAL86695.1 hypothetical protein MYP_3925 [Sporocytophaga myxococcoides]
MKKFVYLSSIIILILFSGAKGTESKWITLLDTNLSKWEMYLSFPHKDGYKGLAPVNEKGELLKPIGYNKNVNDVFTVIEENGDPVLRISGEIYGCVYTKESFENYHLKLKVKWGTKKWVPRLNESKDSGILYHSQGECGVDYWRSWMLSQEFQIIEQSMGDYWCIANSNIVIKALKEYDNQSYIYAQKGKLTSFGEGTIAGNFCKAGSNNELPGNNWNELELITYGDKSLHIVNGKVVMALSNSSYMDGILKPLTKGKIQLQSEAAEVFFKDIRIKPITKIPSEYVGYF